MPWRILANDTFMINPQSYITRTNVLIGSLSYNEMKDLPFYIALNDGVQQTEVNLIVSILNTKSKSTSEFFWLQMHIIIIKAILYTFITIRKDFFVADLDFFFAGHLPSIRERSYSRTIVLQVSFKTYPALRGRGRAIQSSIWCTCDYGGRATGR
jgi:hypothetical protein